MYYLHNILSAIDRELINRGGLVVRGSRRYVSRDNTVNGHVYNLTAEYNNICLITIFPLHRTRRL